MVTAATVDWIENTTIGIKFKLDTGAEANVISYTALRSVMELRKEKAIKTPLQPTTSVLVGIGDGKDQTKRHDSPGLHGRQHAVKEAPPKQ